ICSDRASLPEVVGAAAKLVDPVDIDLFSAAMAEVLKDRDLGRDLVRRGRERIKEFSWDRAAEETMQVYRDSLETVAYRLCTSTTPVHTQSRKRTGSRRRTCQLRVSIDGRFLGACHTGTGRYSRELLAAWFRRRRDAEYILIAPKGLDVEDLIGDAPVIQHIEVGIDTLLNPAWEQFSLPSHLLGCDAFFSPTGIVPVARPCK